MNAPVQNAEDKSSFRVEKVSATVLRIFSDGRRLDPLTVVLNDVGPGAGHLIISCWGEAWAHTAYWCAMGDRDLRGFLLSASADYIATKLWPTRTLKKYEQAYLLRIVELVQDALR